ncbi:MAG: glycerophosphodiester phosphodiesterase family protein [Arcicella sp.]|nr:glycerophosphodiester phosphodiesterase family protein [Arcicella sp.]
MKFSKFNTYKTIVLLLISSFIISSCNNYDLPELINVKPSITNGKPLSNDSKMKFEGIYKVVKGREIFGDTLVLKWNSQGVLSMFGGINGIYAVTKGVKKDSSIYIYGYWRFGLNSETGTVNLQINPNDGSNAILSQNQKIPSNLTITGVYGSGNQTSERPLELVYTRPFSEKVLKNGFEILAHRSGGRTSDLLGISENSLEMIDFCENLGSTGVEIDVRLTRDDIPILYHDEDINIRLTRKSPLNGPIANFTYPEISRFIRLVNGERIPTLEESLNKIVDSTSIRTVWLDMKSVNNAMAKVFPIQQRAVERAKRKNRDIKIYIGIPDAQVLDFFKSFPNHKSINSLCELSVDETVGIEAEVWAPRWTLGTLLPEVKQMQAQNRKVYCWTLDNEAFIKKYINEGNFDGILTNYPTIVAYYHYLRK